MNSFFAVKKAIFSKIQRNERRKNDFMKKKYLSGGTICILSSLMAIGGTSVPVFAANPGASDTQTINVSNISGAAKVTAYRIVKPTYGTNGLTGYSPADGVSLADIEHPTAAETTAIARKIRSGEITGLESYKMSQSGDTYSGSLPAGEFIILVTDQDNAEYVYNPMIVSNYYSNANDGSSLKSAGDLDGSGTFKEGENTVYVKRSKIPFDKEIADPDGKFSVDDDDDTGGQSDDLGVGDTGKFKITTAIPAYSSAYSQATFRIDDNQDNGFDAPTDFTVKVDGKAVSEGDSTFKNTITGNDFSINFNSDYILANAGKSVTVEYSAKLNSKAVTKFNANKNTAALTYTNDLEQHTSVLRDDVSEYTFPVAVKKTTDDGNEGLPGAEFTITRKNPSGGQANFTEKVTTDENGNAVFNRLDEGTYTIKETKAPEGYAVNDTEFTLVVTSEYNEKSGLKSYTAVLSTPSGQSSSVTVDNADHDILVGNITDSGLKKLPSTGKSGTKVFSAVGIGVMGGAAIYLIVRKKKKAKKMATDNK